MGRGFTYRPPDGPKWTARSGDGVGGVHGGNKVGKSILGLLDFRMVAVSLLRFRMFSPSQAEIGEAGVARHDVPVQEWQDVQEA